MSSFPQAVFRKTARILVFAIAGLLLETAAAAPELKNYQPSADTDGLQRVSLVGGSYFFCPGHIASQAGWSLEIAVSSEGERLGVLLPQSATPVQKPSRGQHDRYAKGLGACLPWRQHVLAFTLLSLEVMADPLDDAQTQFAALHTYQVTVQSTAASGDRQVIRYFYRKPGWVRMEFIQPYRGMVLIYNPGTRRVRLWPFGVTHLPSLSFAPDHPLLRSAHGHQVDRSDVGALLVNLRDLREHGGLTQLGDAQVAGRAAMGLDITGHADSAVNDVHHYRVWLTRDTLFPLRVESFDLDGTPLETVDMADAEVDVSFPDRFFTP